jgi:uncharacterized protein (TIGR03000 family)
MRLRHCLGLAAVCALFLLPSAARSQVVFFGGNRPPITAFGTPYISPGGSSYGYFGNPWFNNAYRPYYTTPFGSYGGYGSYSPYGAAYGSPFGSPIGSPFTRPLAYSAAPYSYYSNLPGGAAPSMRKVPFGTYPSDYTGGTGTPTGSLATSGTSLPMSYVPGGHYGCSPFGVAPHNPPTAPAAPTTNPGTTESPKERPVSYSPAATTTNRANIQINVPSPAAQLWVQGKRIESFGSARSFVSPPLEPGSTYRYSIQVRWSVNGQVFTQTQNVNIRAGDNKDVLFPVQG